MSMTREGCGDGFEGCTQDAPEPCEVCGDPMGADRCPCGPCVDCSTLTAKFSLNLGRDRKWRCPSCHVKADLKMCGERPAFRMPPVAVRFTSGRWSQ